MTDGRDLRGSGSSAGEVEVDPGRSRPPRPPRTPEGLPNVPGMSKLATPPPSPTRTFGDDPRVGMFTEQQRQDVQAAVAFHIGGRLPGVEWTSAVQPLADRFLELAGNNPRLVSSLQQDVNTLFALSDMEIAEKVMRGESVSQFGDVFDSIAEVSWEIGATDLAAKLEADRSDAVKGTFDALTRTEATQAALGDIEGVSMGRVAPKGGESQRVMALFDVPGAWSFSPSSGVLAVTVGDETVGVDARPGFDPDSTLDVVAEVVAAQADGRVVGGELTEGHAPGVVERALNAAHEVGGWLDEHPTARSAVDHLWGAFRVSTFTALPGQEGPVEEAQNELADEQGRVTEQSVRMASMVPYPEDATVAAIARHFMSQAQENNIELGSQDALSMAASMVTENRDQFVDDFQKLTQEKLLEELEADIEDESAVGRAVDTALNKTLGKLEWWDDVTQFIGVNLIDAWWDVTEGGFDIATGDWEEGFNRLGDVFETEEFGTSAADYFDLDGFAADAANLAVGIAFDPLNWTFAGAKGVRSIAQRALTNPKFAPLYLRMGSIPKVAEQIAGEAGEVAGAVGVRNVAAMSGLGDDEIVDLVRIALTPEATVDDVNEVLTRALSKDWIGEGPARAIRHSTVEGVGRTLEAVAAGKISNEHLDTIMKMVAKLSTTRTMRLGENQALDNIADLLTQFFPADKDKFAEWFLEAVNRRAAAGDDMALAGVNALTKEQARRSIWETGGTVRSIQGADDLRTVNQNLRSIEHALTQVDDLAVDDAARGAVREQLERMHSVMSRRVSEAQPKMTAAAEKRRLAHKQLKQATYLEADSAANAARNEMAAVIYEIYDDVAEQINRQAGAEVIPIRKGVTNPLAPHVPVRDWEAVTGVARRTFADEDADLSLMMGLSVDDASMARQADAVGMFNRAQHVVLPASPYEVILYQKVGRNPAVQRLIRNNLMKKLGRAYKLVFAFNLLVNPLTAGKISLDETMRFFADTGDYLEFLRATAAGIPGVGRVTEDAIAAFRARFGEAVTNPYIHSYRRNVSGFSADDLAEYGWVYRPKRTVQMKGYREQVERWVNGSLLQDRRFQQYARWLDEATVLDDGTKVPPKEFVDWWDNGGGLGRPGSADARTTTVKIRDEIVMGTEMSASDAFNMVDKIFDHWLELVVDDSARNQMRRTLLQAARGARGGLDLTGDARLLNAVSQVPGLEANDALGSTVFNIFFGAPAGRRSGVFYEYYFDEAMDILTKRHSGRILTADMLMEEYGVSKETAQHWLKQGADIAPVAQMVKDAGMRTEAQLAARAAAYAERRADDLMYRFTASSLAGRGVESGLMFPFARAQVDFLSWWADHLTKPMMLRLSPEVRAKLPSAVQTMVQGVERMPINLRAMAKYAHIAAAVNNDHPSVIDQTIDSMTFLPVTFDSNFLMDISPQFGPVPSWMFDVMVDKDWIDEDMQENMEALFPALGFTDAGSDDIFDYALPNSRRSVRDATVGTARWIAALFGEDIHTNPGKLGQLANIIADGQIPAATGDFQVAMGADFLGENVWSVKPGSDEFNRAIAELAVKGAVEANRKEWGQDWADRVYPMAGYDKEYRALRAYEGMFSEDTFQTMTAAGLFQTNDLLENDEGVPRIRAAWDDYQEGTATEAQLQWLADRLTSAYFDAGRVEVMPGFSYLDYLNLKHPEMVVNLIGKSEDSGIPVRSDDHAEFKQKYVNQLTGRLQNIPPGDDGRELIADARRRGWITSRPVEEWMFDAAAADYKSAQRAVHGVWEWVSHRTWQQGSKQAIDDKEFTLDAKSALVLNLAGMDIEAGSTFTYGDFHQVLDDFDERFDVAQPTLINTLERGAVHGQLAQHADDFGLGLLDDLAEADREFNKLGFESIEDWPEESKQVVRDRFAEAINLGYTTLEDYQQEIEPIFGPLNYEPPTPPAVEDLETGIRVSGDELRDVEVIDGDTLSVLLDDGPMRVRLIGINSPEVTQAGYAEARDNLAEVVGDASELTIGVYKPELFGMSQLTAPGEHRLLAWLYVDGVPLYDPSVFTADNPRGAGVGGSVIDLQAILEANR